MKTFIVYLSFILALLIIGGIGVGTYIFVSQEHRATFTPLEVVTSVTIQATSTPIGNASSVPYPATSTVADPSWLTYSSSALGVSVRYPKDLVINSTDTSVWFVFPKDAYFHWPLQDDVKITVSAGVTCASSTIPGVRTSAQSFLLNRHAFTRYEGDDAGAGNKYLEVSYATIVNGSCYTIDLFDHGTNGAGFYVDDPALITQYDGQHALDMARVVSIFNAMVVGLNIQK